MADWGKRVFLGALLGAALGVLLGLGLARILWPLPEPAPLPTPVSPTATERLSPTATAAVQSHDDPDRAMVLISALYALDGDLQRARERLAALELDDPPAAVAQLALRHAAAGNRQLATDLATLAVALGHGQGELLAYVATPTPTRTPSPTASSTFTPPATSTASPTLSATPTSPPPPPPTPTRRPSAAQSPSATPLPPPATSLPTLYWDHRVDLLSPPVRLVEAEVAPGEQYWRLVRLEWWKSAEGGNTMLYVTTLNAAGQPRWGQEVIIENGGHTVLYTDPKPGEPYGTNFPMSSTLNSYQAFIGGDLPSDRVTGMGLGEAHGLKDHTTFVLVFQLARK